MNPSKTPTNNESRNPAAWSACEAGTLGGLNHRMRTGEARRTRNRLVGGALAATAAVALVVTMISGGATATPGGITCDQCVALIPDYHQQLTGGESLPADESNAVASHLEACPKCRGYFDSKYPGVLATTTTASLGLISFALLGTRPRQPSRRCG